MRVERPHPAGLFAVALCLTASLLLPRAAGAQEEPVAQAGIEVDKEKRGSSEPAPRVVAFAVEGRAADEAQTPFDLEDVLELEVAGLAQWLEARDATCWDVRLFLDGQRISSPRRSRCDEAEGRVSFNLKRIDRASEEGWANLVEQRSGLRAPVELSVGLADDERPLPTDLLGAAAPELQLFHGVVLVGSIATFVVVVVLFFILAAKSQVIRDPGPPPPEGLKRPYSLARLQSAWWFFLVLGAYLLLAMMWGELPQIPGVLLSLVGISAGTLVGSEAIANARQGAAGKAAGAPAAQGPASRGLLLDLVSGTHGVAFHRFQNLVFTLVIGGYFAIKVGNRLEMPELDQSLTVLMGISAGTYLGVKIPEGEKVSAEAPKSPPEEKGGGGGQAAGG